MYDSIFTFNVSNHLGTEYIDMFNDMARFVVIQLAIQLMLVTLDPPKYSFFSLDFLLLVIFIVIGVMLYYLVFRKLVSFK